jgi:hypothetical protein
LSFLVAAALAVGLFVVLPAAAHLLRRGRAAELPFAPVAWVPLARSVARRERRLEDRMLLAIRALAVLSLAALGAAPLASCSRLSLSRGSGGSVALALVLDDSLSMHAATKGGVSRWERAKGGAVELFSSAREGDSVAIVLSGKPARALLASTTDLSVAREALADAKPSDRASDLPAAVALARGLVGDATQADRRVVVLSDFAGPPPPEGTPPIWAPLPELSEPAADCGIVSAERRGPHVTVTLACSVPEALRGRSVELVSAKGTGVEPSERTRALEGSGGKPLATVTPPPRAGVQVVTLSTDSNEKMLAVRLTGSDDLPRDDLAAVAPDSAALGVAVVADPTRGSGDTGGAPLLEQAIRALDRDVLARPLGLLPEDGAELERYALIVLDDPSGIAPEPRRALSDWIEKGGIALALLGRAAERMQLGSTLEPFVQGSVSFRTTPPAGRIDARALLFLGPEASALAELEIRGRAVFDSTSPPGAKTTARFSDGTPFLVERALRRGVAYTVALPSSILESDFALNPAFVALLDHVISEAEKRRGRRHTTAGSSFAFGGVKPDVLGPEGRVEFSDGPEGPLVATAIRGFYRVLIDQREELRSVAIEANEITDVPRPRGNAAYSGGRAGADPTVDVSNETALLLLLLLGLELIVRVRRSVVA